MIERCVSNFNLQCCVCVSICVLSLQSQSTCKESDGLLVGHWCTDIVVSVVQCLNITHAYSSPEQASLLREDVLYTPSICWNV